MAYNTDSTITSLPTLDRNLPLDDYILLQTLSFYIIENYLLVTANQGREAQVLILPKAFRIPPIPKKVCHHHTLIIQDISTKKNFHFGIILVGKKFFHTQETSFQRKSILRNYDY